VPNTKGVGIAGVGGKFLKPSCFFARYF